MGFTCLFFFFFFSYIPSYVSHSPSTLGVQGAALVLLSRQPHTVALPVRPFVCLPACLPVPVCLFLFVWYFSDTQVLCRVSSTFGSSHQRDWSQKGCVWSDKPVNTEAYADAYINRIYEILFFFSQFANVNSKCNFFSHWPCCCLISVLLCLRLGSAVSHCLCKQHALPSGTAMLHIQLVWFSLWRNIQGASPPPPHTHTHTPPLLKCGG